MYKLQIFLKKVHGYRVVKSYKHEKAKKLNTRIAFFMMFALLFSYVPGFAASPDEKPEAVFHGMKDADAVIRSIDYADLSGVDQDIKESIYEAGALNLMKGYGSRQFGPDDIVTKEQAIAIAYKAAGREADAVKEAEALDSKRLPGEKKTDPVSMWSDGYLKLAADDGLISSQDLADAIGINLASASNQNTSTPSDNQNTDTAEHIPFVRTDPAERQEMAFWLAKALDIQPVYDHNEFLTAYSDWAETDAVKIPYIEAVLQNKIINGESTGYFNPSGAITRKQAAQMIVNSEETVLPLMEYVKRTGTVEAVSNVKNYTTGIEKDMVSYDVRNVNGKLHRINVTRPAAQNRTYGTQESIQPDSIQADNTSGQFIDLAVYKNGVVGGSSLLASGDRIEYITAPDGTAAYVKVLSSIYDTRYVAAKVNSINAIDGIIDVIQLFNLETPDVDQARDYISFNMDGEKVNEAYRYSSSASAVVDGVRSAMDKIPSDAYVVLTIKDNLVTSAVTFSLPGLGEEPGVLNGIVEDNNPQLGYITLYNEDGSGTGPEAAQNLVLFRTFSYSDTDGVEVYKNHEQASLDDVETGDTVFIRLDDRKNVISVSAVDNYSIKYGKIRYLRPGSIVMQYDDGTYQTLDFDGEAPVLGDERLIGADSLHEGDRIRLMLHVTPKFTRIKEIAVEGAEHYISAIYKGNVMYINTLSNDVVVKNVEQLKNDEWVKTDRKGITSFRLSDEYSFYSKDKPADANAVNRYLKDEYAYIAVEKDYGGNERAVVVSFRNQDDTETYPYYDTIAYVDSAAQNFSLAAGNIDISFGDGTIIVKYGRLVKGSSIFSEDPAYVVAGRSYADSGYRAGVVNIDDKQLAGDYKIYRGRIKNINAGRSFTLESFSELNGPVWEYSNTPRTFKITADTRVLGDQGVIGQRDFTGYGDNSYIGQTVYIAAKDTDAVLISTAPYGNYSVKGRVFEVLGGNTGEDGTVIEQPAGFRITGAKTYDRQNHIWIDNYDMIIDLALNSIIIKDGGIIKPEAIMEGDKVNIVKRDNSPLGEGYIVIVE